MRQTPYLRADDWHGRKEALYLVVADQAPLVRVAELVRHRQRHAHLLVQEQGRGGC